MNSILDHLVKNYCGIGTVYSPANIVCQAGEMHSAVVNALNALCGEPYRILDRHWFYYDAVGQQQYSLTDEEVDEALSEKEFTHPETGKLVPDFEQRIGLSYSSTSELEEIISSSKKKTEETSSSLPPLTRLKSEFSELLRTEKPSGKEFALGFIRDLMESAVPRLEESANYHRSTLEDALTDALIAPLSFYTTLTRDTNSNGHVDIFLRAPTSGLCVVVGEAKADGTKSYSWYEEGLVKLVNKYSRSSICFSVLIYYFRRRDMFRVMTEWQAEVETRKTAYFISHSTMETLGLPVHPQTFVTVHNSHGRDLHIIHIWINLFSDNDKDVLQHSTAAGNAANRKGRKGRKAKAGGPATPAQSEPPASSPQPQSETKTA